MGVDWPLIFQGAKTILDPLAAASWPIAFGAVIFAFRRPITALIGRIRQVSGFGGTAVFVQEIVAHQQIADRPANAGVPSVAEGARLPPADSVFDLLDQQLTSTLENGIGDDRVKLAWAIRMRSVSEANRIHETTYRLIFGSQIQALKTLNVFGQGPASQFENFYETVVVPANETFHKDRTFEQWGQFLVNAGYVVFVEGADPPTVQITPLGRQFLQWMVIFAVPEVKPG